MPFVQQSLQNLDSTQVSIYKCVLHSVGYNSYRCLWKPQDTMTPITTTSKAWTSHMTHIVIDPLASLSFFIHRSRTLHWVVSVMFKAVKCTVISALLWSSLLNSTTENDLAPAIVDNSGKGFAQIYTPRLTETTSLTLSSITRWHNLTGGNRDPYPTVDVIPFIPQKSRFGKSDPQHWWCMLGSQRLHLC